MQLPPALAPWRRYLAWFDEELAGSVGDLLRRLQPLLGPALSAQRQGALLPDGIDDLRRRGSYARLLLSEWAMAEAEPDEFLRRAAAAEHLFLSPRLVRPRSQQRIVALFDSGPLQLGTPRLVQLALAILLAQRAESLGAAFSWGCLQSRDEWQPLDDAQALRTLLAQRSLLTAGEAGVAHWRGRISALAVAPAECWLVGSDEAWPEASHRVTLRRQFDGGVGVQIHGRRERRELRLPAPPATAQRILRGAFDLPKKAPAAAPDSTAKARFALSHAPLLDRCGRRIAVPLLGRNGLLQVRLPGGAGAVPSTTEQLWRDSASLLAPLFSAGNLGGVISTAEQLHGWNIKGFKTWPRPPMQELATAPGQGRWLRAVVLRGQTASRLLLLDHAGNLAEWRIGQRAGPTGPELKTLSSAVLALHQAANDDAVVASLARGQLLLSRLNADDAVAILARLPCSQPPGQVFLAGRMEGKHWIGCCAFAGSDSPSWTLHRWHYGREQQQEISPPARVRMVGLCRDPRAPGEYALLGLDAAATRLRVCTSPPQEIRATGGAPIRQVSVSADGARIALLTAERELVLVDAATRAVLLRLRSGA